MTRLHGNVALHPGPNAALSVLSSGAWAQRPRVPARPHEGGLEPAVAAEETGASPSDIEPGASFRFADLRVAGLERIARTPAVESPTPVVAPNGPFEVTEPNDPSEVEADRFADAAVELLAPATPVAPATSRVASTAPIPATLPTTPPTEPETEEEVEEADKAERDADSGKQSTGALPSEPPPLPESVGAPLGAAVRERIEPLIGIDLSRVRIHTDARSAALAKHFEARAFANRSDIFFASGAHAPNTRSGLHLLLHEVAHVVQNSGRQPGSDTIARAPFFSGPGVHDKIEEILIEKHKGTHLIAEGVLPGANKNGKELSRLGHPDLYRSSAGAKVPWVRGETQDDGSLKYVPVVLGGRKHPRTFGGKPGHEPTVDKNQNFTGDFPTSFEVAEIKPVGFFKGGAEYVAESLVQSNNYLEGFPEFAKQARADGKSQTIPTAAFLTKVPNFLPPAIDYNNFASDAANPSPAKPNLVFGPRRYWVYPQQSSPVLHYVDLPHPYAASDYTKALDDVFAVLEGVKNRLGDKQYKLTGNKQYKFKSTRQRGARGRRRTRRVARKTDWKAVHTAWEADRLKWDDTKAKPYLKTDAAKAVREKAAADRFLKLPVSLDAQGDDRAHKFRQVELFSGRTGKILGDIRYALAPVFEKIGPFFEWLKQKFTALVGKLKQAKTLIGGMTWAQTILDVICAALRTTVQEAVSLLFGKFQSCIIGMIDNFVQGFTRDLTDELEKPFETAKKAFFDWLGTDEQAAGQLITDVQASFTKYEAIVDGVMNVQRLVDEIKVYELVIRGIVEAISCATPPGLGCLWGLVAQLAPQAIVDLAMTSDLFQDKVVRPLVRDLLSDILDEPFSRIVSTSMEAIGLGKYGEDVTACHITPIDMKKLLDQAITPGLKITDPALLRKREEWEKAHEGALLDAAEGKFIKKDGKPATRQEIKRLMEATRDLLPSAGNIQDAVAGARRADGKIDFQKLSDWAQGKVKASPRVVPSGGFSADPGHRTDPGYVKDTLGRLDLAKASASQLVAVLEDSRDSDGNVNVDQFARRMEKHVERQQLKRDIEAQQPDLRGVPKQAGPELTDPSGTAASSDQLRELVESLAKANLGEVSAAEKVAAARGANGKVDVAQLKAAVDAAAGGLAGSAPPGSDAPSLGAESDEAPPQKKPEPKQPDKDFGRGPRDTGPPFRIGPFDVGPQPMVGPEGTKRKQG
ncbi:DUF4157 domain-containing protein [Rhodococcus sp. T2V]|uniref:eCIS core domain-containing protein n=1 Tax=Rhodococcus sp. T2V TaxID=3034164 RepID=UPI0023E0BEEA|nr:DUF4157 domain-containing protein [Rhodococcus sp. T2V]MDF3308894.1 DUF4157 domain-containing protein [Rhodococcus sp. T2V]